MCVTGAAGDIADAAQRIEVDAFWGCIGIEDRGDPGELCLALGCAQLIERGVEGCLIEPELRHPKLIRVRSGAIDHVELAARRALKRLGGGRPAAGPAPRRGLPAR